MSLSSNKVETFRPSLTTRLSQIGESPLPPPHLCIVGCESKIKIDDKKRFTPKLEMRLSPGQPGPCPSIHPGPSSASRRP